MGSRAPALFLEPGNRPRSRRDSGPQGSNAYSVAVWLLPGGARTPARGRQRTTSRTAEEPAGTRGSQRIVDTSVEGFRASGADRAEFAEPSLGLDGVERADDGRAGAYVPRRGPRVADLVPQWCVARFVDGARWRGHSDHLPRRRNRLHGEMNIPHDVVRARHPRPGTGRCRAFGPRLLELAGTASLRSTARSPARNASRAGVTGRSARRMMP